MSKAWVSPFEKIVACYDPKAGLVELMEDHARGTCFGGSAWSHYHIPRNSPIVIGARREGTRNFFLLEPGRAELDLEPGISQGGVEECKLQDDTISITYSGLGGAGVGMARGRGLAKGVGSVRVHSKGGGGGSGRATLTLPLHEKVTIGMDDTDSIDEGATWSLANEIGYDVEKEGIAHYLMHTITQLFPEVPEKTTNCVSTACSFGVAPGKRDDLVEYVAGRLKKDSLSSETGMAVFAGIKIPRGLEAFTLAAKAGVLTLDETRSIAEQKGVELIEITGEMGLIGAMAALGLADDPDRAIRI
jgi:methanogenesis imperfect marker protein 11